jgi:hypothetical protein
MPNRALTDDDIKLLNDTFVTKEDVRKIIKEEVGHLPTKNEFFTAMSEVMGELKAVREEIAIASGHKDQLEDHEDQLENHEDRISTLESVASANA